jgi:uncharacterized protein YbdZ (MbtH family)
MDLKKQQLTEFYQKHEPSKVGAVDTLLTQYKFEDVVASLKKKYGTVPAGWDPSVPAVPPPSKAPAPAPAPVLSELEQRKQQLTAFYQKYEPSKVSAVGTLLTQYKFEDVKASLLKKYNTLPEGWDGSVPAQSVAVPAAAVNTTMKPTKAVSAPNAAPGTPADQLANFYKSRDPSKAAGAAALLEQYKIEDISFSLLQKYGALPAGWAATAYAKVEGDSKSAVLEAGQKLEIPIAVTPGSGVKWYVALNTDDESVDVGFEAYFVGTDYGNFNKKTQISNHCRLKLPVWPEGLGGNTEVTETGKVVLVFDNSYSWVKCKIVSYKTQVTPPTI